MQSAEQKEQHYRKHDILSENINLSCQNDSTDLRPGAGSAVGDTGSNVRPGTDAGPLGAGRHHSELGWLWPHGSTAQGSAASLSGSARDGLTRPSPAGGSGGSACPSQLAHAGWRGKKTKKRSNNISARNISFSSKIQISTLARPISPRHISNQKCKYQIRKMSWIYMWSGMCIRIKTARCQRPIPSNWAA